MNALELLHASPSVLLLSVAVLGLLVGSFLNVVIHRLPAMMERAWRSECSEVLEQPVDAGTGEPFNLVVPRSRCPHCGHPIRAWENVPILSYLFLRGRCSACGQGISARYPFVEALTAVLSVAVVWQFGLGWTAAAGLALTWLLVPLAFIDLDTQLLPDHLTMPGLWLGLAVNLFGILTPLASAVVGAMAGYGILWLVYQAFRLATGKEGMGYGDFKLLAMLGAWLGWQALPAVLLLGSVAGAVIGIGLIVLRGHDRRVPIPFGPYLALGGWVTLMWGERLLESLLGQVY